MRGSSRAPEVSQRALPVLEIELAVSKVVIDLVSEEVVINGLGIEVVAKLHSDGMTVLVEIELEEHQSTLGIVGRFLEAATSNAIV